jgi:hypothetical protein
MEQFLDEDRVRLCVVLKLMKQFLGDEVVCLV